MHPVAIDRFGLTVSLSLGGYVGALLVAELLRLGAKEVRQAQLCNRKGTEWLCPIPQLQPFSPIASLLPPLISALNCVSLYEADRPALDLFHGTQHRVNGPLSFSFEPQVRQLDLAFIAPNVVSEGRQCPRYKVDVRDGAAVAETCKVRGRQISRRVAKNRMETRRRAVLQRPESGALKKVEPTTRTND